MMNGRIISATMGKFGRVEMEVILAAKFFSGERLCR
jgi:hypothetical protein